MPEKREKVRVMLFRYHLSQLWLMHELEKNGISVDKSSLSEILTGRRKTGSKTEIVISGALSILERYERCYVGERE